MKNSTDCRPSPSPDAGVAIPATFGYNLFAARLNRVDNEMDAFGTEIIAMLVREGQI